ncbi:MAG TPA: outer membrane lipoprotein carrier protein LolA [Bacteroidales bacterium]|nr:MAG: lipoprotein chaperone [Bacteroidetes bacterium ADurb.Bin013]HNR27165.1 outer membrane lipoprotein carrier protein LolA [Bacteroidales bacterium]HNT47364.1 outer membrane lipoprotein carrier protein LolA [Bacteroidales bacterium]HOD57379.1 outer membrane lipoprotein carrier protein LolA [Bacteroidales bacterium]HOZ09797.1 outer membrane lipoprotein carrier protein LolA [Bacteroidales bacterium]
MIRLVFSLLLTFTGYVSPGVIPQTVENRHHMMVALKSIHTLECEFQQEREVTILAEKGISRGKLAYEKNKALLWQYQVPDYSGFLLRGKEMTILDPSGKPLRDAGSAGLFRHIGTIILMGIEGSILEDRELFVPECIPSEDYIHIRLIPSQREMKRLFTDLELFFRKEDYVIQTVVINETSGDKTTVRMGNIRINRPLDDTTFDAYVYQ